MDTHSTFRKPLGQRATPPTSPIQYHFAHRAPAISIEEAFEITLVEYFCWHRHRTVIGTWELAAQFVSMVRCWNWDDYNLWQGKLLRLTQRELHKYRKLLIDTQFLYRIDGVNGMFVAFTPDVEAEEIIAQIDPFGCFAFGTAMYMHGLIDRPLPFIYTKTPPRAAWRDLAMKEMQLQGLPCNDMPVMREPSPAKFAQFGWIRVRDVELARDPSDLADSVTCRAQTFIDMTRAPAKCGGWTTVAGAFRRCDQYDVEAIVHRLSQKGTLADRARMGFLLEYFGVVERAPDAWVASIHHGGSLKLDASAPYASTLDERWKLSINVPEHVFKG